MRLFLLVLISTSLAQEALWSEWSDWSACESEVYNRIRRCYTTETEGGRSLNKRLSNEACSQEKKDGAPVHQVSFLVL